MPRHIWTVISRDMLVDERTDNVSLINVVEQIILKELPPESSGIALGVQLWISTLWTRADMAVPEQLSTRISLIPPNGQVVESTSIQVDLQEHRRARTFVQREHLPYFGTGFYEHVIEVEVKEGEETSWVEVTRIPLEVGVQEWDFR